MMRHPSPLSLIDRGCTLKKVEVLFEPKIPLMNVHFEPKNPPFEWCECIHPWHLCSPFSSRASTSLYSCSFRTFWAILAFQAFWAFRAFQPIRAFQAFWAFWAFQAFRLFRAFQAFWAFRKFWGFLICSFWKFLEFS